MQAIRAIYEEGHLRLLDPVNLVEGEQIAFVIVSEHEQVRTLLGDLLVDYPDEGLPDVDEEMLLAEINAEVGGKVTFSDVILEERREGP